MWWVLWGSRPTVPWWKLGVCFFFFFLIESVSFNHTPKFNLLSPVDLHMLLMSHFLSHSLFWWPKTAKDAKNSGFVYTRGRHDILWIQNVVISLHGSIDESQCQALRSLWLKP